MITNWSLAVELAVELGSMIFFFLKEWLTTSGSSFVTVTFFFLAGAVILDFRLFLSEKRGRFVLSDRVFIGYGCYSHRGTTLYRTLPFPEHYSVPTGSDSRNSLNP